MSYFNEISIDDYNNLVANNQAKQAAQNLANRQAGLQAAQNKKQGGILDSLSSVLSGIAKSAKNTATGIAGTLGATATNNAITNGVDTLGILLSGKASDLKSANALAQAKGKKREEEFLKQTYGGNGGKDTQNRVLGTNLDAAATLADFIPGVGKVGKAAINVAQGAASGFGQEFAENGANADINRAKQSALIGGASGLAGDLTSNVLGKVGTNNIIGKAANSNLGRGIITGATAGATGGGLAAGLNGGSLADVLANAAQGAKGGAIGGGTMAGIMGIGGALASRGKKNTANTPVVEPEEATLVTKQRIAPTAESVAQMPEAKATRKGIAITDYYAGPEDVQVNRVRNAQKPQGKYIDGVVKGQNLPEAEIPSAATRFAKAMEIPDEGHTTLASFVDSKGFGEDKDILNQLKGYISNDDYKALKAAAYDGDSANSAALEYELGGVANKTSLPPLNRAEAYDLFGKEVAQELPKYMLSKDGISFYDPALSDMFPQFKGVAGEGSTSITANDVLDLYKKAAETDRSRIYTTDNIATGLALNPELSERIMGQLMDINSPSRKVAVQGGPAVAERIVVETPVDLDTQYVKRTLPAKQYEQPIAETTAQTVVKNTTEAPTARQAQNVAQTTEGAEATGWGNKDMAGAVKKRNVLQKLGDSLQETGQATKDSQVYAKLKGNTAEEMARKNSVQRLRELGFKPSDYKNAANMSEVANKWYADQVAQTKTPVEAPQLRDLAKEVADDLRLNAENRADLEKLVNGMLDDAVARDGKMTGYSLDRYTPSDLEKVAKAIGIKEQNLTTTNMGGSKKANRNLTPENEQYANALREVRNRLRNEIGEMADYNEPELVARLKKAGATQKQIDYVTQDHSLKGVKARTSLFEDARTMEQQIRSDALKRGANASKSTNFTTQVANEIGASGLVSEAAKPVAGVVGTAEKALGRAIGAIGDAVAGDTGKLKQAAGAAGKALGGASNILNNETLNNATIAGQTDTYGNMAAKQIARQAGLSQAEYANNRRELANATEAYDQAANDYMLGQQQVAQARAQAQASQQNDTLGRIANAMDMALAAGDTDAYNKLADLYTQAYKIDQMRNPQAYANTTAKDLTASQSKALAAKQQLEALAQMSPNAGTVASGLPILGGIVDLAGGNEYATASEALATTLGYLLSGANIKESEAKSIGKSYVPTVFDSEKVRQRKLAQAQDLINSYLGNSNAITGNQQAVNSMLGM